MNKRISKAMKAEDALCIAETFIEAQNNASNCKFLGFIKSDVQKHSHEKHLWSCSVGWTENGVEVSNDLDAIIIVDARSRIAAFADEYFEKKVSGL